MSLVSVCHSVIQAAKKATQAQTPITPAKAAKEHAKASAADDDSDTTRRAILEQKHGQPKLTRPSAPRQ
jgi:hypothetical protein